jgi:hypothetical protein
MAVKKEMRSPIKDRPLRLPGQSLTERRDELLDDKVVVFLVVALFMVVTAGLEWYRYLVPQKPAPVLFTVFALAAIALFAWRIFKVFPELRNLRLAIDGEKAVGQFLESLRERGYKVFHDLVSDRFNVDHVIIGPAGVFTIETKTWRKPARGEPRIDFDGEKLVAAGREPDRDPVIQAKAQASWLQRIVKESTGRAVIVRPVVVFPGWYVKQSEGSTREIWVLEPKALPGFLDHEENRLTPEDVQLISYHVSRHIRVGEAQRI